MSKYFISVCSPFMGFRTSCGKHFCLLAVVCVWQEKQKQKKNGSMISAKMLLFGGLQTDRITIDCYSLWPNI